MLAVYIDGAVLSCIQLSLKLTSLTYSAQDGKASQRPEPMSFRPITAPSLYADTSSSPSHLSPVVLFTYPSIKPTFPQRQAFVFLCVDLESANPGVDDETWHLNQSSPHHQPRQLLLSRPLLTTGPLPISPLHTMRHSTYRKTEMIQDAFVCSNYTNKLGARMSGAQLVGVLRWHEGDAK